MGRFIVGIAGASGAPYTKRVLQGLLSGGHEVKCVISDAGRRVLEVEERILLTGNTETDKPDLLAWLQLPQHAEQLEMLHHKNVAASIASGSYPADGMVVVPCSGGTLAKIAHGVSSGLLERAADVCLKERRKLILVTRETPLSLIHLRNMTAVTEAGAIVLPGSPGFYHQPNSVQDLVDMIAGRILAHLGIDTTMSKEWTGPEPTLYAEQD
jgi:4-hydroxy-3-polyprenylbenzoate decarboxylase